MLPPYKSLKTDDPADFQRDNGLIVNLKLLTLVNVGRVDLAGSLDLDRKSMNGSKQISEICAEVFTKAKRAGLKTSLGGGIDIDTLPVIQGLDKAGLIDRWETRRLVFVADAWRHGASVLQEAVKFELLYLYSLRRYGSRIQARDKGRIAMIESRLGGAVLDDGPRRRPTGAGRSPKVADLANEVPSPHSWPVPAA